MRNKFDIATFDDHEHLANVVLQVVKEVGSELSFDIGILCSKENAFGLINIFVRNGIDLVHIEDTISLETEHCSLFGGYRVISISNNKLSLYSSDVLEECEWNELLIEDSRRTRLIISYCEYGEDIIAYKFANANGKCDCEHDGPNKVEVNSEPEPEPEPDNNENLDCIANININGDRKTFKFKNYDDMKEFCNLCEQVLGIG